MTAHSAALARFLADGILRLDAVVPPEVNEDVLAAIASGEIAGSDRHPDGTTAPDLSSPLARVIATDQLAEWLHRLLGASLTVDHHRVHNLSSETAPAQRWHTDSLPDERRGFDVQLFYLPTETTAEMGGTEFLPGSHLVRLAPGAHAIVHHVIGAQRAVCAAGTVFVAHHQLWHRAGRNLSSTERTLVRIRINTDAPVPGRWSDHRSPGDLRVAAALGRDHRWYGATHRTLVAHRIASWRELTADTAFDIERTLERKEAL